jgi:carbamoyltransferase
MLLTARSRRPDRIPAVTHLDHSSRLQTVDEKTNPLYYRLHRAFERLTECPVLINTSFNVRGEPIVRSPLEAIRVFLGTRMDLLVLGSYSIHKRDVSQDRLLPGFHHEFKPD